MLIRLIIATVHLLALGIGLGAVWARGKALRGTLDAPGLRRVLTADGWWGGAGAIWLGTGLLRAFAKLEKGSEYYLHNYLFHTKITLFVIVILLEIGPMIAMMRWRRGLRRGEPIDTRAARRFSTISIVQAVLVVLMAGLAVAMARGFGVAK